MISRVKAGLNCYKFGFGQSPFPVPEVMVQALQIHAHEKQYLHSSGLEALKLEIANFYTKNYLSDFSKEQIVIGPGSKELLFLTQFLAERSLVLPAPSWVSYAPQATYLKNKVHYIPTSKENAYKLDPDDLAAYLQLNTADKHIMILNAPNNPAGHIYSKTELQALAAVARKHDLLIISDEIYSLLIYDSAYRSIADYYPEGTIICSGLSKAFGAGGWRIGWMAFPKELQYMTDGLVALASETFSCVSSPTQMAAVEAFKNDACQAYLKTCNHVLTCVSQYVNQNLNNNIHSTKAQGGFYTTVTINKPFDSTYEMCEQLLQDTGVAILAGEAFGNDKKSRTARLAFVDFDGTAVLADKKIMALDAQLAHPLFQPLKEGIHTLNTWANR